MPSPQLYSIIWLVVAVVLFALEAVNVQLVSIWFGAGALVAVIPAALGAPIWTQLFVFAAVSGACVYFTRPFVKKVLSVRHTRTNADSIIGETALVTEEIDNSREKGGVYISGLNWMARSSDGAVISEGAHVRVTDIQGVKAIVERIKTDDQTEDE